MTLHYLLVDNDLVVNRIVADEELPPEWFMPGETWVQDDEAQIGWSYDGATFTPPPDEAETKPAPSPMALPPSREEFDALEARVTALEANTAPARSRTK